ncbi:GH1 family beta-glucosidase [Streptomyces sp. NPDC019224]|uniref:GH1 family beta-glucosidase n=1 Tax=Streptomyces sp. NPDC019224 TaxID=3154484 RepID=UPI0033EBD411
MTASPRPRSASSQAQPASPAFPSDFLWGVATSAYQIEGAASEDGRTPSIWDVFAKSPGATADGDHGDVACDHYHRMPQDVALIASLGVDAYRFSVSWPRVQPHGKGPANARGLAFYDELVDELLASGVQPWITLYHWDLPQELEEAGGWPVRDTAYRFAEYASLVHDALADRVQYWTTLNEPRPAAFCGYHEGTHAPGRRDFPAAVAAAHHLLLGHGLAAQSLRASGNPPASLGITLDLRDSKAATNSPLDLDALRQTDALENRIFLDPLLRGSYPQDLLADLDRRRAPLPVRDGDLAIISAPLDVLGVNYYTYATYAADPSGTGIRQISSGRPQTAMGWDIAPDGLGSLLNRLTREFPAVPLVITENGAAFNDLVDADGAVHDSDRVRFLNEHLHAVADAMAQGADVRGYFAWSLMDNFEWAEGYRKRFGIVHVDYATQIRTLKDSALWYRDLVAAAKANRPA